MIASSLKYVDRTKQPFAALCFQKTMNTADYCSAPWWGPAVYSSKGRCNFRFNFVHERLPVEPV